MGRSKSDLCAQLRQREAWPKVEIDKAGVPLEQGYPGIKDGAHCQWMQTSCSRAIRQVSVVSRKIIIEGMTRAVSSFKEDNAAAKNEVAEISQTPGRSDVLGIRLRGHIRERRSIID